MLSLRKPNQEVIDRWLKEQHQRDLNYPEVGATRAELPASGYTIDRYTVQLGHGEATYERAVAAIRGLHMWDFDWVQLCWPTTLIEIGSV